jgi:hypothetical protein
MPNEESPFRLYPGSNDAERKILNSKVNKQDDLMMDIIRALILIVGIFTYLEYQRLALRAENQRLKDAAVQPQQVVTPAPSAAEIAEELKKALEQKPVAPVEPEKKPEKPVPVKRGGKSKPISVNDELFADPSLPLPNTAPIGIYNE